MAVICAFPFSASASFDVNLKYGSRGDGVVELQEFLADQGVYSGPITGNFFSLTLRAVKNFQIKNNIVPTSGYFGPLTRAVANTLLDEDLAVSNTENVLDATPTPTPVATPNTTPAQTTTPSMSSPSPTPAKTVSPYIYQLTISPSFDFRLWTNKKVDVANLTISRGINPVYPVDFLYINVIERVPQSNECPGYYSNYNTRGLYCGEGFIYEGKISEKIPGQLQSYQAENGLIENLTITLKDGDSSARIERFVSEFSKRGINFYFDRDSSFQVLQ